MDPDSAALAARNNAAWCDIICRSHAAPGEFRHHAWSTLRPTPPFYPNVVTLSPNSERECLEVVDEVVSAMGTTHEIGVKDSFATLDLTTRGFRPIIEARWFMLAAPAMQGDAAAVKVVERDAELVQWEQAWSATSPTSMRMFRPDLLGRKDVSFIAGMDGKSFAAGIIANQSEGAVGVSNFFAAPARASDFMRNALTAIATRYPGEPLVGYAGGPELTLMRTIGFQELGPLRVWVRQPPA